MWDDFEDWDPSENADWGWWLDDPVGPIDLITNPDPTDPYLYQNIFAGYGWPDTMDEYENDFSTTGTNTGGFWSDLGDLFGNVFSNVAQTAAGASQAAATAWIKKNIAPTPTGQQPPAAPANDWTSLLLVAGAAAAAIYFAS